MSRVYKLVLTSMLSLASSTAVAQDMFTVQVGPGPGGPPQGPSTSAVYVGPGMRGEMGLIAVEPFESARPVLDAPYTAEAVTEVTQVLADGNRISRHTTSIIARDGRGRTRREHQAMFLGSTMAERQVPLVTISDPSAGSHVTLDNQRRVAMRAPAPAFGMPPMAVAGKRAGVAFRSEAVKSIGTAESEARTEKLGERNIEGVRAEGTLTKVVIPAGAIGNELPIEVVSERWYSPELQVVVMTRRSDPRFGETTYRLTNIVRGEPSPELFEVPSGYRVEEPKMMKARPPKP
jgi:hypothetical protein